MLLKNNLGRSCDPHITPVYRLGWRAGGPLKSMNAASPTAQKRQVADRRPWRQCWVLSSVSVFVSARCAMAGVFPLPAEAIRPPRGGSTQIMHALLSERATLRGPS